MKIRDCIHILLLCGLSPLPMPGQEVKPAPQVEEESNEVGAEAEFQLAKAYLYGQGRERDLRKAYEHMLSAADQGYPDAVGGMGFFYLTGMAVKKDPQKGVEWFRKGATLGSAKAQLNLARHLLGTLPAAPAPGRDDSQEVEKLNHEGIDWLQKAAGQGLPDAAASLGGYCYYGEFGKKKDLEEAERWFKIAAEAGDATSQNFMGIINDPGVPGGKSDRETATRWYLLSAKQGNIKAQANLGKILDPFSKNREARIEALAWTLIAEAGGEITAKKRLAENRSAIKDDEMKDARIRAKALQAEVVKPPDA